MEIFENTNSISYSGGKTDILKFILSLFIVAIHFTEIPLSSPVLRCAVPLFFMLSSFFFFKKFDNTILIEEKKKILINYISRNLKLYLFWFIVLLPYTVVYRGWFDDAFIPGLVTMLKSFVFSSTFPASWYIMASVIGTSIIALSDKFLSNRIILIISLLAYVFCVITSNYGNIIEDNAFFYFLYEKYRNIFTSPYNSFPVSLLWIYIGRYLSRKGEISLSTISLFIIICLCLILLYGEYFLIQCYHLAVTDDCYFMLAPTCYFIIILFGKVRSFSVKPFLRKASTIIFCSHITIGGVFFFLFKLFDVEFNGSLFLPITICSITLSWVILKIEKSIKILRYAY